MEFGKLKLAILWFGSLAAFSQVVPGWFILELNEAPVGRVRGVRRIRESQTSARAALAARLGARAEIRETTEVVMNALIVRSDASESDLAAIPGVKRVWPVYELHPELDRAVQILRIKNAWESVGGSDRAGAGIKIGILDTGLDLTHPAFQSNSQPAPDGFPRATNENMRAQLNAKVIAYRTYDAMMQYEESTLDNSGHGTAVAMAAAGVKVSGRLGEIQGAAPGAWLGIYKIFSGPTGDTSSSAVALKALDDALADGMDVINVSWGSMPQVRQEQDPLRAVIDRAAATGVAIVKSVGNSGPARLSGSSPTVGPLGLVVGAAWTDRIFASGIRVNGGAPMASVPGSGPAPAGPVTAPIRDAATVDASGLACAPPPAGSFAGAVVLILRGECTFEDKINNAQAGGAVGVVVYTHANSPNAAGMSVGGATLPAVMISNRDGLSLRAYLVDHLDSTVEMAFDDSLPFLLDSDGVSDFSSRGPGTDGRIVPDLLAIGEEILTATQRQNQNGELYDPSGFVVTNGTSFASPLVSGAYAILKSARPGLTAGQYRSLLVNTAQPFPEFDVRSVQVGGAGRLDLSAAMRGRLAMDPVSVSFGLGPQRLDARRTVRVQNVSSGVGTWKVDVDSSDAVKVVVEPSEFSLGPGDSIDVQVRLAGDFALGEYQGALLFRSVDDSGEVRPQRMAYWYGVPSGIPTSARILPSAPTSAAPGSNVSITMLITDAIGGSAPNETPKVTMMEGSGSFISATSLDADYPGYWLIRLRVGSTPGETNRFRIEAGYAVREVSIRSR